MSAFTVNMRKIKLDFTKHIVCLSARRSVAFLLLKLEETFGPQPFKNAARFMINDHRAYGSNDLEIEREIA